MLIVILIYSLLLSSPPLVPADEFEIVYRGVAPSDHFYTDQLDNIYFIDGHKIVKIETATGTIMEYGSLSAGMITSADVSNPLQILIFYRGFNQMAVLNSKLALIQNVIEISDLGIGQATEICSSGRGGIWVFSDIDNQLVYFDQQFRITNTSKTISSITGTNIKPVFMTEVQNKLYLHIPGFGILVFDRFASLLSTIPYSGPDRFQVVGNQIVFFHNGELFGMDIYDFKTNSHSLPPELIIDDAQLQQRRIFILSDNAISLFKTR